MTNIPLCPTSTTSSMKAIQDCSNYVVHSQIDGHKRLRLGFMFIGALLAITVIAQVMLVRSAMQDSRSVSLNIPKANESTDDFGRPLPTGRVVASSPDQLLAATNHSMGSKKLPNLRASNTTLSELIANNNLKIVSGYWKIPNNTKHNVAYYEKGLNKTIEYFRTLDVPLVFYHNIDLEKTEDPIANVITTQSGSKMEFVHRTTAQLRFQDAHNLVNMCKHQKDRLRPRNERDKPTKHRKAMIKSTPETWREVITVWISKLSLVQEVILENPQTGFFGWMDAGLFMSGSAKESVKIFGTTARFDEEHVFFRSSPMRFNGTKVHFRAGIMLGSRKPFLQVIERFRKELEDTITLDLPLCYDEEALLTQMYNKDSLMKKIMKKV